MRCVAKSAGWQCAKLQMVVAPRVAATAQQAVKGGRRRNNKKVEFEYYVKAAELVSTAVQFGLGWRWFEEKVAPRLRS